MKFKKAISVLLTVVLIASFSTAAYADVNIDSIIHGDGSAVGRYSHNGEYGWVVECYVATTESGKLDPGKTLTDGSNAAYLGRVAFTVGGKSGLFPAMQRPVAIQLNGGGETPPIGTSITIGDAGACGYDDPFSAGVEKLRSDFQIGEKPLKTFWEALANINGGVDGLQAKIASSVSQSVKDKMKAIGDNSAINPTKPNCPVEYAFVLTPLVYLRIKPGTYSTCDWNTEFWMSANEAGVLNRYSKQKAVNALNEFIAKCATTGKDKDPAYPYAVSQLQTAALRGELTWFQDMSHKKLPDSATLERSEFGIGTAQPNA